MAIEKWFSDETSAIAEYGYMNTWNVFNVTDMSRLFMGRTPYPSFPNISNWNVSNVTNMYEMFYSAIAFNQDIGGWDVGKVISMDAMLYGALAFNQNISEWVVGVVTRFDYFNGNSELTSENLPSFS